MARHDTNYCAKGFAQLFFHCGFVFITDVAEIVLTKCLSKGQTSIAKQAGPEAGEAVVNRVLYDYEFIEDYNCEFPLPVSVPEHTAGAQFEMKQPAAKREETDSQTAATISSSQDVSSDEDLFWLEDIDGPDEAGETREEDKSNPPSWGPKGYFSLQHPLTLMVSQAMHTLSILVCPQM